MAKVKIQFPGMIIPFLGIVSVLPKEAKVPVPRRGKAALRGAATAGSTCFASIYCRELVGIAVQSVDEQSKVR